MLPMRLEKGALYLCVAEYHDIFSFEQLDYVLCAMGKGLYICLPSESNGPNLLDKPLKSFIGYVWLKSRCGQS